MRLLYLQKALIARRAIGSGVFSQYNIFAQWGQVLIPLFPMQHAGAHWKHTGRQAGRHQHTHTHTHTHFVSHRIRLTEKGNLDHHETVKLAIKAQTNDISSLLYLFRGRGRSRIHVNTPRHAQIQLPNPNMSPGLLKISTALKYWITFGPLLLSICFETHIKWSLSAFHQ